MKRVVLLSGGVGGARFADGLAAVLPPEALTIVVNTGDDFEHWGLRICPDLDTIIYTLAGLAHPTRGWGLERESFEALAMMKRLGGPPWFALGDRDLAVHLHRTEALRAERLTTVTAQLARRLGVRHAILPMCDGPRPTRILTAAGEDLPFQRWLVEKRAPRVRAVRFEGPSAPTAEVLAAIEGAAFVIIGPSNPYVSIDPILALDGVRERIFAKPVIAVSPIVHGAAVKGPLAEMISDLEGRSPSAGAVAAHYPPLAGVVVEQGDEAEVERWSHLATRTVMGDRADRTRLAREVLELAAQVAG